MGLAEWRAQKRLRQREERAASRVELPAAEREAAASASIRGAVVRCKEIGPDATVDWPLVRCQGQGDQQCAHADKWSRMMRWKQDWHWVYRCVCCVAAERQISLTAAKAFMESVGPQHQWKAARAENFRKARDETLEQQPMLCGQYKQLRQITCNFLTQILEPLAVFLLRKQAALEVLSGEVAEARRLQEELRTTTDGTKARELISRLEVLRSQEHYIAFRDRDRSEQHRLIFSASYSDTWSEVAGLGALRSWFLCRRGGAENECGTATLSKTWVRSKPDPTATGMKFYCPRCKARYSHSSGAIIEVSRVTEAGLIEASYGLGDVPPHDLEDVRAAHLEEVAKQRGLHCATPMDVFNLTSTAAPATNQLIRPANQDDMWSTTDPTQGVVVVCDLASLDKLPRWDWWALLGLEKPEKKKKRRR